MYQLRNDKASLRRARAQCAGCGIEGWTRDRGHLSREHIPPKLLGGTFWSAAVLCSQCNNYIGNVCEQPLKYVRTLSNFWCANAGVQSDFDVRGEGVVTEDEKYKIMDNGTLQPIDPEEILVPASDGRPGDLSVPVKGSFSLNDSGLMLAFMKAAAGLSREIDLRCGSMEYVVGSGSLNHLVAELKNLLMNDATEEPTEQWAYLPIAVNILLESVKPISLTGHPGTSRVFYYAFSQSQAYILVHYGFLAQLFRITDMPALVDKDTYPIGVEIVAHASRLSLWFGTSGFDECRREIESRANEGLRLRTMAESNRVLGRMPVPQMLIPMTDKVLSDIQRRVGAGLYMEWVSSLESEAASERFWSTCYTESDQNIRRSFAQKQSDQRLNRLTQN